MRFGIWVNIFLATMMFHFSLVADDSGSLIQVERMIATFKIHLGDILYPQQFAKFQEELAQLRQADTAQNDPDRLRELSERLTHWTQITEQTQKRLSDVIDARERAIKIGAATLSSTIFQDAEQALRIAAENLQKQRDGRSAQKARELYQQAERQAIQDNLLGEVRILLHECTLLGAETLAPQQFRITRQQLGEVESLLSRKNIPQLTISQKSQELMSNARQLLFLLRQLKPLNDADESSEIFLANLQKQFQLLANDLNTSLTFSDGFNEVFAELRAAISSMKAQIRQLKEFSAELYDENLLLSQELALYQSLSARREFVQRKIERILSQYPGKIEERGGLLVLRLGEVQFAEQEYAITARNANTLDNARLLLNEFADSPVIVRFIQSATQDVFQDQQLANWRAAAICDYLQTLDIRQNRPYQPLGLVYKSDDSSTKLSQQLEILIDLEGYYSVGTSAGKVE